MLLFVAAMFIGYAAAAVGFPASLRYSEGVVWQQLLRIPGPQMYGSIAQYPFTVFEYPPVYYLVVRGVMAVGIDALQAGRGVSLAATLISCCLLGTLIWRSCDRGWWAWAGGALGGLLPLTLMPVIAWVPTMRVDMLGLALTLSGLMLTTIRPYRRPYVYSAMAIFVAAVFTKQTFVAAPLAVACVGMVRAPRVMLEAVAFGCLLAAAATALLSWLTNGGFLVHVLRYNLNRFSLVSALHQIAYWTVRYAPFWAVVCASIFDAASGNVRYGTKAYDGVAKPSGSTDLAATMIIYLFITTVMTLLIGKSGSWLNYLIEWMWVGCFWIGRLTSRMLQAEAHTPSPERWKRISAAIVPLLLLFHLSKASNAVTAWRSSQLSPQRLTENNALLNRMRDLHGKIMSDDMVVLRQAGAPASVETFIFAELSAAHVVNEQLLVSMLQSHAFAAVLTEDDPGNPIFDSRYRAPVEAALLAAYPRVEKYGDFRLRLLK